MGNRCIKTKYQVLQQEHENNLHKQTKQTKKNKRDKELMPNPDIIADRAIIYNLNTSSIRCEDIDCCSIKFQPLNTGIACDICKQQTSIMSWKTYNPDYTTTGSGRNTSKHIQRSLCMNCIYEAIV